jgi:hypothetical protein
MSGGEADAIGSVGAKVTDEFCAGDKAKFEAAVVEDGEDGGIAIGEAVEEGVEDGIEE